MSLLSISVTPRLISSTSLEYPVLLWVLPEDNVGLDASNSSYCIGEVSTYEGKIAQSVIINESF